MQAMERTEPLPPAALQDVEQAAAGQPDAYLHLWAARLYAYAATKPPHVKTAWNTDPQGMRERCREHLRKAVEAGAPDAHWNADHTFLSLLGDPDVFAKDWARPAREATDLGYWRSGNPLVEFAG
jgi:hypothetical protein